MLKLKREQVRTIDAIGFCAKTGLNWLLESPGWQTPCWGFLLK
jgi:hypothetical protein